MPKLNGRVPKYSLHRASGQAIVTLNGTDHYLGESVLRRRLSFNHFWLGGSRTVISLVLLKPRRNGVWPPFLS